MGKRCRELLRETARAHDMVIHAGSINRDQVHLLVAIPPRPSVSRAVEHLKGRSLHNLLSEFGILRKRYWASTYGHGDIGLRAAATSPVRSGRNTSRTRRRRSRTTILPLPQSAAGRTEPALSRNLKPPPLGGGVFTNCAL